MTFTESDIDWLADMLADAARREIMPRFRKLDSGDIRQKTSASDLVTEADVNAERVITAALRARYPDCRVIGEEAVSEDKRLLDGWTGEELAFTIDPVDGTFNFATGVPVFGVMLGVVVGGQAAAGIIHDPVGGDWIMASKGGGAFLRHGDGRNERIKTADTVPVAEMIGSVSWQHVPEPLRSKLARNQAKAYYPIAYRCAAQEYRFLAQGRSHFGVHYRTMPWDHVPGALIVQEAGGYVARFDGTPYRPEHIDGGIIAATDKASWQMLQAALLDD